MKTPLTIKTSQHDQYGRTRLATQPGVLRRAPVHALLQMQQALGNHAVGRFLQSKLTMNQPADIRERAAESAAPAMLTGQVVSAPFIARDTPDAGVTNEEQSPPRDAGMGEVHGVPSTPPVAAPAPPAAPKLTITRQVDQGNSFISTDTISFKVEVTGAADDPKSASQTSWTVQSASANSGNGNPHSVANKSDFSFKPNPTNRPKTGSRSPNAPIKYQVQASTAGVTATYDLEQDETDIIRQEYLDHGPVTPPGRGTIVTPGIATYNTGNYSLIVDAGMDNALTNTTTAFQQLTQQAAPAPAAPSAPGAPPPSPVPVPAISVESGYRNPQRNVAVGSEFPVSSKHVWGRALDLGVAGANATLWARLREAGEKAGNSSICEDGPTLKPCNDPSVDHVHIQW